MIAIAGKAFNAVIIGIARYSILSIVSWAFVSQVVVMYVVSVLIFPDHPGGFKFDTAMQHFFAVVIFAPVLETWLFQECIIKFSRKYILDSWSLSVFLSALIFSLTHTYSIPYVIVTFLVGILYGMLYLAFQVKKADAFLYVAIIHALYNLFGFIMNRFILNS